jgi:hypothetical protein
VVVTEPSCTEQGFTTYTCECGESYRGDFTDVLGHDWVVKEIVEPTCDAQGYTVYECSRCGETKNDDFVPPISVVKIVSATPTASVKKLTGNKNDLTITITEKLSDGTINVLSKTFSIDNNAAATYTIGSYKVYVDTKGNTQIRACYII